MDPQNTKIMIVDDEENIVLALEYIFTSAGYEVRCFTNGADALEQVGGFAPEVVILDVMMPGMDGLKCRAMMRAPKSMWSSLLTTTTCSNVWKIY